MIVEILYALVASLLMLRRRGSSVTTERGWRPRSHAMEPGQRGALGGAGRLPRRGRALGGCRGAFGSKPLDVLLEDLLAERADVLGADTALLVDEEGLGHAVDAVIDADFSGRIGSVREAQLEVPHELQRLVVCVLDVHAEDDDAPVAPRLPAAVEHRRL